MPEIKTEFVSALPLEQSWKLAKCSDKVLPKVLPHIFAKCERLEGDGGAGTVRVVTLGSASPAAGQTVKEKVEVYDDATHTVVYSTVEGGDPRFKHTKFTIKFSPGPDANSTTVNWCVEYTPVNDSVPAPEELKTFAESGMKAIEGYAKEHPNFASED